MTAAFKYVRLIKGKYPFFRTRETGSIRLPAPIGSSAFLRAYADAIELRDRRRGAASAEPDRQSWAFLADTFLASAEFAALATSTQIDYLATCKLVKAELGEEPFALTTRAMLKAVRDGHAGTPRKAHKIKQMTSRLFGFAAEAGWVPDGFNPAAGLKRLATRGGVREITVWSDAEIAWVLAAAGPSLVTPLLIALYTGQRREDVAGMTWSQWQGDLVRVRTSKTRALLDIACHPVLRAHLEALRRDRKVIALGGQIALTAEGKPWSVNGLSGKIRRLVERIDAIPGPRSMHGLRYAAAARMEEGGATHAEIAEVLGQRTFRMALKYAGQRVRARAAVDAMPSGNKG